jgi:hypothetical protein
MGDKTGNPPPADGAAEADKARAERLNTAAKTILTATTLSAGVLTAFGISTDRVPQLLDNESSQGWLFLAAGLAFAAFLFGVFALLPETTGWTIILVGIGAVALAGSMGSAVAAAGEAFIGNGRPTVTAVTVSGSKPAVTVSFTVHADGVNVDERIEVFAGARIYLPDTGQYAPDPRSSFHAVLRPNDMGVIDQKVTFTIDPPEGANTFAVRAIRADDVPEDLTELTATNPAKCDDVADVAPACVDVDLPAPGLASSPAGEESG